MICCVECFNDTEIISIIISQKKKGECEICDAQNTNICETELLSPYFETFLNIYSPIASIAIDIPDEQGMLLKNALYRNWNIFNLDPDRIQILIEDVCQEKYRDIPALFNSPVIIPEAFDAEYLEEHSILNNVNWDDFVYEIKYQNRFFLINKVSLEILDRLFSWFTETYYQGKEFFRARQTESKIALPINKMGAPPKEANFAGRANPKGISVLYLANDIKTTIFESRARVYDYLTVGTFELLADITVISFRYLDKISPFILDDITEYAINRNHLSKISTEIAKPLRRHDSDLDYLPTQYLTEYIKSMGFDGIEYDSTINPSGYNLAIFDETKLECSETQLYEVTSLEYDYSEV